MKGLFSPIVFAFVPIATARAPISAGFSVVMSAIIVIAIVGECAPFAENGGSIGYAVQQGLE
jgi:hypothetical protein